MFIAYTIARLLPWLACSVHALDYNASWSELYEFPNSSQIPADTTRIYLAHNYLTNLAPHQLSYLTDMVTLDVNSNSISYIAPGTFDGLHIELLNLGHNQLSTLPDLTPLRHSLTILNLTNNPIANIAPFSFTNYSSLHDLGISFNLLKVLTKYSLSGVNSSVDTISLSYNKIYSVHKATFQGTTVKAIDLGWNKLASFPHVADISGLTTLDLSHNMINTIDQDCVNEGLSTIFIPDNVLESIDNLTEKLPGLVYLDATNNPISITNLTFIQNNKLRGVSITADEFPRLHGSKDTIVTLEVTGPNITCVDETDLQGLLVLRHLAIKDTSIIAIPGCGCVNATGQSHCGSEILEFTTVLSGENASTTIPPSLNDNLTTNSFYNNNTTHWRVSENETTTQLIDSNVDREVNHSESRIGNNSILDTAGINVDREVNHSDSNIGNLNITWQNTTNNFTRDRPISPYFPMLHSLTIINTPLLFVPDLHGTYHLRHLTIVETRITHVPGEYLLDLKNPVSLNLSRNQLNMLPDLAKLGSNHSLKIIDISGNAIRNIPCFTSSFVLPYLTDLYLGNNYISRVCHIDFAPSLKRLYMARNRVVSMAFVTLSSPFINYIDISYNSLLQTSPRGLNSMPSAIYINMSHNSLNEFPEVTNLRVIQILSLEYNGIRSVPCDKFPQSLSLVELHLQYNKLHYFCNHINYWAPRLTFVDLRHNKLKLVEDSQPCHLGMPPEMFMANNQWDCSIELCWLFLHSSCMPPGDLNHAECLKPPDVSGRSLLDGLAQECVCKYDGMETLPGITDPLMMIIHRLSV